MGAAELREPRDEIDQRRIGIRPVEPGRLVVLGIGIVVAPLRAAEFIAGGQHRRAARQEQRGQQRALIPLPAFIDAGVIGGPSAPLFQEISWLLPSRLSSPFGFIVLGLIGDEHRAG